MNARTVRFAFLLILVFSTLSAGQSLKPTEIIYSRLPNNLNAPPTGANQPTIWAVGQDGSNDRMITTGTFPRISDDGRFLLFKRFTRHPSSFNPFGGYADFFIRELATGQETLIAAANFDQGSIGHYFSPESNQGNFEIIFDDSCLMYKMNRDGSGITYLYPTTFPSYCADDFPVLRRGGDQLIAFQNLANDVNSGLYTVAINGTGRQKIPNTNCGDINPAWANDGEFIAFGILFEPCSSNFPQTAYPYFVKNLYKIRFDGSGRQQLTNFSAGDCRSAGTNCLTHGMVWTEDNSKLITAGRINGVPGLFAFNTDGNAAFSQIPISPGNAPDFVGGIVQPREEAHLISSSGGVITDQNGNFVNQYSMETSIGEALTGNISGGGFTMSSGFLPVPSLAPTAAEVSVGGQVVTVQGSNISNAVVLLTDRHGAARRARTNAFGYFRFENVMVGETYIFAVASKRFTFSQPVQSRLIQEETYDIIFVADF